MGKRVRRRRSAQAWGELVKRQEASGLSAQAFCGREQVSARVFYRWRARLRSEQPQQAGSRAVPARQSASFIDLGELSAPAAQRWEIRLDLGAGIVLHLARG